MTPGSNAQDRLPVERFLGPGASAGGPYALLELTPRDLSDELIVVQLQRQLSKVASHPQGASLEADAVRLALHAAAAQLLEEAEETRSTGSVAQADTVAPLIASGTLKTSIPWPPGVAETIATYGGLNHRALERIAHIAATAGLPPHDLIASIRAHYARPRRAGSSMSGPQTVQPAIERNEQSRKAVVTLGKEQPEDVSRTALNSGGGLPSPGVSEPISGNRTLVVPLLIGGGLLALLLGAALLIAVVVRPSTSNSALPQSQAEGGDSTEVDARTTQAGKPKQLFPTPQETSASAGQAQPIRAARDDEDFSAVLRELSKCIDAMETGPSAAIERFESMTPKLAVRWVEAAPDQLVAMQSMIVEFVYRASREPAHAIRAVDAVAIGVSDIQALGSSRPPPSTAITAGAWSAGMLTRLGRERELPSTVLIRIQSAFSSFLFSTSNSTDSTFQSGASAALLSLARRLSTASTGSDNPTGDTAQPADVALSWRSWLDSLGALNLTNSAKEQAMLVALEQLLTLGGEPTQSKAVFDAAAMLTVALSWRADSQARLWLIRWFDDPAISNADLNAVTSALAGKSAAANVDISMVVSATSGDSMRADVRDRLKLAWGISSGPRRGQLAGRWLNAAQAQLNKIPEQTPALQFSSAVALSRLSAAAEGLFAGLPVGSFEGDALEADTRAIALRTLSPASIEMTWTGESAWAVRWFSAPQNMVLKRELLSTYQPSGHVLPIEAEAIAGEAIRGSAPETRREAQAILRRYSDSPAVVNAVLEAAPTIPNTREVAQLVADISRGVVPSVKDPAWRVAARRLLVERLIEVLSGKGELGAIDDIHQFYAESYAARVALASLALSRAGTGTNEPMKSEPPDQAQEGASDASAGESDPSIPIAPATVPPIEESARRLRSILTREAQAKIPSGNEPIRLDQIAVERAGRLRLCEGRVQAFAAEQVSIAQILAFIVSAEQPSRAVAAASILVELQEARNKAQHIAAQIEATERSVVRLWMLRMEGGAV